MGSWAEGDWQWWAEWCVVGGLGLLWLARELWSGRQGDDAWEETLRRRRREQDAADRAAAAAFGDRDRNDGDDDGDDHRQPSRNASPNRA